MEEKVKQIWKAYGGLFRFALAAALAAYGFALTNVLQNHDSIGSFRVFGMGVTSGRWFLDVLGNFVDVWWGIYSLPYFSGLMAILFAALAGCLTVSALRVKSRLFSFLTAGIFIVFPSLGGAMLYMFATPFFAFAVLLSVLAAWLTDRYRLGFLPGGLCLCLSMGIYQAYLPLTASLLLLCLLRRCFSEDGREFRSLFLTALRYLAALVLGVLLYFLFLRFFLWYYHAELSNYRGLDQIGHVQGLVSAIVEAWLGTVLLPFRPIHWIALSKVVRISALICILLSLLAFAFLLWKSRRPLSVRLFALFCFLLLPLSFNLVTLMGNELQVYELMAYGMVCLFFTPVVLLELAARQEEPARSAIVRCRQGASALLAAALALSAVNYAWQDNVNYMVLYYTDQQTVQYFSSVLTRIRAAEGYSQEKKLAVVGDTIVDRSFYNSVFDGSGGLFFSNDQTLIDSYSWFDWWENYFAFAQPGATEEELRAVISEEELAAMPCYPDDGSIRVIGDVIVLNLGYYS